VRFLSCEPLLGPVDLLRVDAAGFGGNSGHKVDCIRKGYWSRGMGFVNHSDMHREFGPLHWVIVGGESGPKARPCRLEWIRDIVRQCEAADVAVFVKRVREYPTGRVLQ
jgi:protein gp37